MGGLHSGCTDKTENVFLEAAYSILLEQLTLAES